MKFTEMATRSNNKKVIHVFATQGKPICVGVIKWFKATECYAFFPSMSKRTAFTPTHLSRLEKFVWELNKDDFLGTDD